MASDVILLDRDGVLNELVIDPEQGTIDSPLHPSQVRIIAGAAEAVAALTRLGLSIAVVTNQPAAAKGKTTANNLHATHARVMELIAAAGGRIAASFMCLHRSEDGCECRKPKPKLLIDALQQLGGDAATAWMVGDGVTDVDAGQRAQVRTAFLGPKKCDACKIFDGRLGPPTFWGVDLASFVAHLQALRQ